MFPIYSIFCFFFRRAFNAVSHLPRGSILFRAAIGISGPHLTRFSGKFSSHLSEPIFMSIAYTSSAVVSTPLLRLVWNEAVYNSCRCVKVLLRGKWTVSQICKECANKFPHWALAVASRLAFELTAMCQCVGWIGYLLSLPRDLLKHLMHWPTSA